MDCRQSPAPSTPRLNYFPILSGGYSYPDASPSALPSGFTFSSFSNLKVWLVALHSSLKVSTAFLTFKDSIVLKLVSHLFL